jgi:hypothetical protein
MKNSLLFWNPLAARENAEGPKLVYLVSEAKPNERHLAQHLKNGKKLRVKIVKGSGKWGLLSRQGRLSRAAHTPLPLSRTRPYRQEESISCS